jgi:hypothetical protein
VLFCWAHLSVLFCWAHLSVLFCWAHLSVLFCWAHLSVRHQERLNPVVEAFLDDPIGDGRRGLGTWNLSMPQPFAVSFCQCAACVPCIGVIPPALPTRLRRGEPRTSGDRLHG